MLSGLQTNSAQESDFSVLLSFRSTDPTGWGHHFQREMLGVLRIPYSALGARSVHFSFALPCRTNTSAAAAANPPRTQTKTTKPPL